MCYYTQRISIMKNDKIIQTNTYILNFNAPKNPSKIKIGYIITQVKTDIPNPLRCHHYRRFMHHCENVSDLQYVKDAERTKQTTLTVNNHGTSQTVNKTMQLIQKLICMDKRKKE